MSDRLKITIVHSVAHYFQWLIRLLAVNLQVSQIGQMEQEKRECHFFTWYIILVSFKVF